MDYITFQRKFKDFTIFSINDIRQIDETFQRRRLHEWQEKDYLIKVIKGYYIFSDLDLDEHTLFEIANRIYKPSYVSLETALSFFNLIPEGVYGITSVSTRRTYRFSSEIADFIYRKVKSSLFFGYRIQNFDGKIYKIAEPEKALLDYFYLNPHIKENHDFSSLRINPEIFSKSINKKRLRIYLGRLSHIKLALCIEAFIKYMEELL